jgi:diguanylate cyclase (GGDEF)-like protein/PAS domain S-box-containing protein
LKRKGTGTKTNEELCRIYREIFENTPVGIFTATPSGEFLMVNPTLVRMLGCENGQSMTCGDGQSHLVSYCGDVCFDHLREAAEHPGSTVVFEARPLRLDSTAFLARFSLRFVPGSAGGEQNGFMEGMVEDITAQREAEEALSRNLVSVERKVAERTAELRESNAMLRAEVEERRKIERELRRSRHNLRVVLDGSYDAIFVHDISGRIIDVNRKMLEMYGVSRERALELSIVDDYSAPDAPVQELPQRWDRVVAGEPQFFEWMARRPHDGTTFQVEVYLRKAEMEGEAAIIANVRDISDRAVTYRRIRTLSRAVEQSPVSVVITDPVGRVEYVNPKFTEVTGYSLAEVIGRTPSLLKSGAHPDEFYRELWTTLSAGREWRGEFLNETKDGRRIWESASISPVLGPDGAVLHYVAVKEDITDRKEQEERIRHLALYDPLTGLPNRTLCMDRIAQASARVARYGGRAALLYLDLNKFKPVNDTFGHEAGDEVLREVAVRVKACLREMDTAARIGGDEFVIILQEIESVEEAVTVAERVRASLDKPFLPCGRHCGDLGVSIGVSICPDHGQSVDSLIKKADQAMYRVKGTGKSGVSVWTDLSDE